MLRLTNAIPGVPLLRRLARREDGVAALEFGLIGPVVLSAILGVMELGRIVITVAALNHAYGFASRGNVDGALQHIHQWIRSDPYPGDAWPWFFGAMLKWEDTYPALRLAQDYLDLLLEASDSSAAVKLMLRCKYANEEFRPHADSRDAAIAQAESLDHREVVEWLRRR